NPNNSDSSSCSGSAARHKGTTTATGVAIYESRENLFTRSRLNAYGGVLGDAMHGDATLFAREDYVEEAWRIVDAILTVPVTCTPATRRALYGRPRAMPESRPA